MRRRSPLIWPDDGGCRQEPFSFFPTEAKKMTAMREEGSDSNLSPRLLFSCRLWLDDLILLTASLGCTVRGSVWTSWLVRRSHERKASRTFSRLQGSKGVCVFTLMNNGSLGTRRRVRACVCVRAWQAARGWTQRMLSGWACGTASLSCLWPLGDGHKLRTRAETTDVVKWPESVQCLLEDTILIIHYSVLIYVSNLI